MIDERLLPSAPPHAHGGERILVAGVTPLASRYSAELLSRVGRRRLVGLVSRLDEASLLEAVARTRPDTIVLGDRGDERVMHILSAWRLEGFPVEPVEGAYERLTGRVPLASVGPGAVLEDGFALPGLGANVSRLVGWIVAVIGLTVVAPLLLLLAVLIRLDSPGPVFYVQERLGLGGRPFRLFKLRTMHVSEQHVSEWAGDNRDRIT
ncbi:MAG TPA: sugar transferase, partial [bacterium]|nr:sugar transferase [bacterium]